MSQCSTSNPAMLHLACGDCGSTLSMWFFNLKVSQLLSNVKEKRS